ncbi:YDG domain-containing protein [Janthinobacterium sp. SUN073]|uniref:YDG domain-containing protein n=1 Tax=Janthinobacterium sp. SUN073 TaxID=3004102 RepID=UPI0025AEDF7E|nr:YDG domain-containing protein [Janthinobacterium sp. SUN073]MDN2696428.1 YDG domain-containing protein [Janthinobacterium sp. SUN073]
MHASMNHIYRLIWSEILGAWVAVAENARGKGKRSGRTLLAPACAALGLGASMAAFAAPPAPTELPAGAKVVGGQVVITQNGAAMNIQQGTARGAIDWQTFNLGAKASVNFAQPSASAVTLNRVLDAQPSQIFGRITSNGQVFLSNPNGVYFSPSASVDVGGLVATTHNMSSADFMAGMNTFSRAGATGSVINEGSLHAALGGYIALLAPEVRNYGLIMARAGTVALASGEQIKLQFGDSNTLAGVVVTPSAIAALVENRQAVLAPGGTIIMSAQAANRLMGGVINNTGALEANGLSNDGGRIMLTASDQISASGSISANAAPGSAGRGGTVTLIADLANAASRTDVSGSFSARGGDSGGDGGFIETSASHLTIRDATRVDARAAHGKSGRWLLDPDGFTIAASGGDISGATLSSNLATADVAIASTNGGGSDGNVTVNDAITWSANKLTLTATNDVNINAVMTASGTASLDLEPTAGKVNTSFGAGNTFKGKVNFAGSGTLTIKNQIYTVINSLGADRNDMTPGTLQGVQASQNAFYALGSDIDATSTAAWNASGAIGMQQFSISWGAFDGLGHVIIAPTINNQSSLFASLYGDNTVQLRNLGIVGGTVNGAQYASGMVGRSWGTISNSFSTMNVTGFNNTGGLVGESQAGIITNSYAGGTISGTTNVGGLVGRMFGGQTTNSYASGNVTGTTAFIGGLAGVNYFGTISSSYASGNVTGSQTVGGLVGLNQQAGGSGSNIINTYATGAVNGNTNVGGLVGENGSNISNSYAVGAVTINNGNTSVGGLVGTLTVDGENSPSVISNSFWDTQTSGQAASRGGTGKTTAEMKAMGTFTGAGWNFSSAPVWQIKASVNNGYPCLTAFANCTIAKQLSVHVNSSQSSNIYGDLVGTFTYSLFNGSTLLDANGIAALGLDVSGSALFGGAPSVGSNAGHYQIIYNSGLLLGGVNAGDYVFLADAGLSYTVFKRPLGLVATREYNGGTVMGSNVMQVTNLVGSDCSGGLSACGLTGSASVASKNVSAGAQALGLGGLTLTGSSALDTNYTLTGASGTGTITPRSLVVFASGTNRVYNGGTADIANLTPDDSVVFGDALTYSYTSANFLDKNVGNGKTVNVAGISIGGLDAGNYALASTTAATTANITPRPLAVFASGTNRVYNGGTVEIANLTPDDSVVFGDALTYSYTSANFLDKNVGTGKTVNVTGISLGGADAGNYAIGSTSATTQANITTRPLSVFANASNRVYNGTTTALATLTPDDSVVFGDQLTYSYSTANFLNKNVGTGKTVNVGGISIGGADAGNYSLDSSTATTHANITPRSLAVFASGTNRVYNGGTVDIANLTPDDSVVFGDALTYSYTSANFLDKNVGNGKTVNVSGISIGGLDAGNYSLASTTVATTANITPRALQVFASGSNRVYNGGTGDAVTLTPDDSIVFGDQLTYSYGAANFLNKNVGIGKTVNVTGISLGGADAGNYAIGSTSATTQANITARPLSVFANAGNRVYNGTTTALATLTPDDSVVFGDQLTYSYSTANFLNKNVGTGKTVNVGGISIGGADAGNYSLDSSTATTHANITPRSLAVFASGTNRVYNGGTVDIANLTPDDSVVFGDALTYSYTSANFLDKNVGNGKTVNVSGISIGGLDAGNYALASTTAATTANITPRPLAVFASGTNRVYNGGTVDIANLTPDDSVVFGDALTYSYTSANFLDKNVGNGKTVNVSGISIGGLDAGNYSLASTTAATTANITPRALQVFASGSNRVYNGGTGDAVTLTPDDSIVFGDQLTYSYSTANFLNKNVGTGKTVNVSGISIGGADAGNYSLDSSTATTHANITPRSLAVFASGTNRVYDGGTADIANLTPDDSVVTGDVLSFSYASANFLDKNVGVGKTVNVSGISMGGSDGGNYTLENTTALAHADITPRMLKVSASGANRVYDGSRNATVALADDRVAGDVLSVTDEAATFSDKNVGTAKAISVTGIEVAGTDAANYAYNTSTTTTADITARALTVSASGVNRIYNGGTDGSAILADNRVAGDLLTLTGNASFADKNAGVGKTMNVSNVAASGADAANYVLGGTGLTTTANITPRALTVGATGIDRQFDGTVAAMVVLADNRIAGDLLTLADGAASFASADVGSNKPVTVTGISIAGSDAANYSLQNTSTSTIASILAAGVEPTRVPQLPVTVPVVPAPTSAASPLTLQAPVPGGRIADGQRNSAITVSLVRPLSDGQPGMVSVSIPKDMVSKGDAFSFALPAPLTAALSDPRASVRISRTDDAPLPAWLRYVAQTHSFDVSAAPAGALPFEVKIMINGKRWILVLAEGTDK